MFIAFYYLYLHRIRWLSVVPRERFLIITKDELREDAVADKIASFLGDESHFTGMKNLKCYGNVGLLNGTPMLHETRQILQQLYEPFNELLAELLEDPQFLWNACLKQ